MSDAVYIYAFCDSPVEGRSIEGLEGHPVRFLGAGAVHAAVSDAPGGRLRPQRRLLAAHQSVLAAIAGEVSTLPAAFGLVADSEELLIDALEANGPALLRELDRVDGCVEMEVRLAWDVPDVFNHLVSIDEPLEAMRDELAAMGDAAPHSLRVEVGRRVERVLAHHREQGWRRVADAIADLCREIDRLEPSTESELVRLSALVSRDRLGAFEAAIEAVASEFDETHAFRLAGPFAPHSFVDLHLDLGAGRQAA